MGVQKFSMLGFFYFTEDALLIFALHPLDGFLSKLRFFFCNEITSRDSITSSQAHLHKRHEGCCIAATALVLRLFCYVPTTFFINRIRIAASCARVALSAGFRVPSV